MRASIIVAAVLTALAAGCVRRFGQMRIGQEVDLPQGLDSVATVKWVAAQRAACPGKLQIAMDHMPIVSLDGSPVPYHSEIVAVRCDRP